MHPALPSPYKDNLKQRERWESCCKVTGLSCQSPNPALGLRTPQEMKYHTEKPPVRQGGRGEHHTLQSTWFSSHRGIKSHISLKGGKEQAGSIEATPLQEE